MEQNDFLLAPPEGTTPKIGALIAFLKVSSMQIFNKVAGLSREQLDFDPDDDSNSIGTLLKHMAAIEYTYQAATFENRQLTAEERQFWKGALPGQLIDKIIHGQPAEYYLALMEKVREHTYHHLRLRNDEWLFERPAGELAELGNNYYCWYHVMQDHLSHYGQIKLVLKKLKVA